MTAPPNFTARSLSCYVTPYPVRYKTTHYEQVKIIKNGETLGRPFLDLSDIVDPAGEGGLLGLAFHPNYAKNRCLFVNYTARQNGALYTIIRRFKVSSTDPDFVPVRRGTGVVMKILQPAQNHNGGALAFKRNLLYIATGDGGGAGDPQNNAQNLGSLLGKILRIRPRTGRKAGYWIPSTNPFRGRPGRWRPEIFHYGLRNPWKMSFDAATGDLYIGDVGQSRWEEINRAPSERRGMNFGWRRTEGRACYNPQRNCLRIRRKGDGTFVSLKVAGPILAYRNDRSGDGCSVTGGYYYRGNNVPALSNRYVFGDFCTGKIWSARRGADGRWRRALIVSGKGFAISSFGQDNDNGGALYIVDFAQGNVHELVT